ncbi:MAG: hypothetical protein ACHQRJ_19390 [Alphaproteobacteria bacterium]
MTAHILETGSRTAVEVSLPGRLSGREVLFLALLALLSCAAGFILPELVAVLVLLI